MTSFLRDTTWTTFETILLKMDALLLVLLSLYPSAFAGPILQLMRVTNINGCGQSYDSLVEDHGCIEMEVKVDHSNDSFPLEKSAMSVAIRVFSKDRKQQSEVCQLDYTDCPREHVIEKLCACSSFSSERPTSLTVKAMWDVVGLYSEGTFEVVWQGPSTSLPVLGTSKNRVINLTDPNMRLPAIREDLGYCTDFSKYMEEPPKSASDVCVETSVPEEAHSEKLSMSTILTFMLLNLGVVSVIALLTMFVTNKSIKSSERSGKATLCSAKVSEYSDISSRSKVGSNGTQTSIETRE